MRLLVVTPIFPNRLEPLAGPYNRQQLKSLVASGGVDVRVLCSVPHLPGARWLGAPERAATLADLGRGDVIDGLDTRYLHKLYVPKIGAPVALPLYLASLAPHADLARWADVVLGTWLYPDGCAAALLARAFGKPCVVKVHGSDVNVVAKRASVRAFLKRILPRADAVVAVSRALADELETLGADRTRIHLVRNGVDRTLFGTLHDRAEARRSLGLGPGRLILYVGRLEPQKGVGELLDAFDRVGREFPDATLALVGDGVWRQRAEAARARFGAQLVVAGARPLTEIPVWMAACDVVTLPSWNEGTPNVLLEALACGRPAVATRVGGIPDVLADPASGLLVPSRDARALADALCTALARTWDEQAVRACGPGSWDDSAARLREVLESVRYSHTSAPRSDAPRGERAARP